jgi:hypothetical protein
VHPNWVRIIPWHPLVHFHDEITIHAHAGETFSTRIFISHISKSLTLEICDNKRNAF